MRRISTRAPALLLLALLASVTVQTGCVFVGGYSSEGGWFFWPGGLLILAVVVVLWLLMRRRRG